MTDEQTAPTPPGRTDFPRFTSHKTVAAIKIGAVGWAGDLLPVGGSLESGSGLITPDDPAYAPFTVSNGYMRKHGPTPGGYFVRYEDGYESFSPPSPFESGYTPALEAPTPAAAPEPAPRVLRLDTPGAVDAVARVCHEANLAYCLVLGDPPLPHWDDLEEAYRESTRSGVRGALEGRTPAASHAAWTTERLLQGWVYGPMLDREAKIHPNLIPYDELPEPQKRKDALFLAIVDALAD